MSRVISARVDDATSKKLEKMSLRTHLDKTSLLRIIILKGLKEQEKQEALTDYQNGEISLGKFAEILEITYWDALELLNSHKIPLQYDKEAAKEDLEYLP